MREAAYTLESQRLAKTALPDHWTEPRLAQVAQLRNGADYKAVEAVDGHVPVIGSGGPFAFASRSLFDGAAVLLGRKGTIDRPLYWDGPFWTVDTMFYAVPHSGASARFLYYYCTTIDFDRYSTNTALPSMSSRDLKALRIPTPPVGEQRQIAAYLDRETGQIDELIAKQEQLLTTLAERRRAVVSVAVAPEAPGQKWRKTAVRRLLTRVDQGVSPEAEASLADDHSWGVVKAGCVNGGSFDDKQHKRLPQDFPIDDSMALRIGDFIVNRASGSPSLLGSAAIVRSLNYRLILSDKTYRLQFSPDVTAAFMAWYMQSLHYRQQVLASISGAGGLASNLSLSSLRSFILYLPPVQDQISIIERLEADITAIDVLAEKAAKMIALLRERRQALISAAVTGKIDVRSA